MKSRKSKPLNKPIRNSKSTVQIAEQTTLSGPLPSSSEMEKYNAISPELVIRIISMAEREAANRHKLDKEALQANIAITDKQFSERKRGQILGFCIGSLGLLCSVALAWIGYENAASIVGGSTVIGLVGVFVTGQFLSNK